MKRHAFYPVTYSTVRARPIKRLLGWVLAVIAISALMSFGTALLLLVLDSRDAQLESVFMQGMTAGAQMCRGGV